MFRWLATVIVLLSLVNAIENANILGVFPLPSKSHFVMFERILKGLADKGHDVDVVGHFPLKKPHKNYNDLSLVGSQPILVNNLTLDQVTFTSFNGLMYFMVKICGVDTCKASFATPLLQDLRKTSKKYDLLITELFTSDCMMGFAHIFDIPVVSFTSSVNLPWASDRIGNPDNPSYIPTYFMDFSPRMTLWQRLENTISLIYTKILFQHLSVHSSNQISKEFFGSDLPDLQDLIYKTSVVLVNSHFSMNQVRPIVPGFVEVGGVHIENPKPLSEYFQNVLKTNTKGIIYLSMGSMVKTESFPKEKIQALFDAFAEVPYKIIWKAVREDFPEGVVIPKNIHFEKWMPQLDILCSSNIQLFVSHGGLMGSQEAIYCGVPRLGIPIFADQELNIRQSENMGLAIRVGFDELTKETVLNALKELLRNDKYKTNAKKASEIFKDRPLKPLETALYWIEYVIRHKGAPHLRSIATELTWYQYYLLDVGFILLSITILALLVVIKLLNIMRLIIKSVIGDKIKED